MIKDLMGTLRASNDNYYNQTTTLITGDSKESRELLSTLDGAEGWVEPLYAGYFNGASYLQIASDAAFAFPNGTDFTIEMWVNLESFDNSLVYETVATGGAELRFDGGTPTFKKYASSIVAASDTNINLNTWTHVAVSRSGTTTRMFVNGTQTATTTGDTNAYTQAILRIGSDGTSYATGYISNLRVVKGQALYTESFSAPSRRLTTNANGGADPSNTPTASNVQLLSLNSPNILADQSSSPKTFTQVGNAITSQYRPFHFADQNDKFSNENTPLLTPTGYARSFVTNVRSVEPAPMTTYFVKDDNTAWACGYTATGQYGNGLTATSYTPVQVMSGVQTIASGGESEPTTFAIFLKTGGTAWATGYNAYGQFGNGTATSTTSAVQVMTNVQAVACGMRHTIFLKTDGTTWATGNNAFGQLGDGTTATKASPVQVMTNVQAVACGQYHTIFLKTDGTAWATGYNTNGQLGDGTTATKASPVQVMTNVQAVACGHGYTIFLKTDGTAWATGYNLNGQFGNGTTTSTTSAVQVMTNVQAVACGSYYIMYLKTDGTALAIGYNTTGQLGDGTTSDKTTPVQVMTNVQAIYTNYDYYGPYARHGTTFFLKNDGSLMVTGKNNFGQHGDGGTTQKLTPKQTFYAAGLSLVSNEYTGYFDSGSYMTIADNTAFTMTGDFTIECYWKSPATFGSSGDQVIWCIGAYDSNGLLLSKPYNANLGFYNNLAIIGTRSTSPSQTNTWYHLAAVRSGTTLTLFVDGSATATLTGVSSTFTSHSAIGFSIGGSSSNGTTYYASTQPQYISNVRVTKGQALYTTNFTRPYTSLSLAANGGAVPSTNPTPANVSLMTMQQASVYDEASLSRKTLNRVGDVIMTQYEAFAQVGKVTSRNTSPWSSNPGHWSEYFDGASYMTLSANAAYTLSGDFTVECWANTSTWSADTGPRTLWSLGTGADSANLLKLQLRDRLNAAGSTFTLHTSSNLVSGTLSAADSRWHHVAAVRSGNNLRLYVDGVQSGSTAVYSQSLSSGASSNVVIGRQNAAINGRYNGYISNLRIVNGTAVYGGAFTPPVAPLATSGAASISAYRDLTNVNTSFLNTQCSLLTFQDSRPRDNSPSTNTLLVSAGNPATVTQNPFSLFKLSNKDYSIGRFDGSSYLTAPASTAYTLSGDFTIECWYNTSVWTVDTSINRHIISMGTGANSTSLLKLMFGTNIGTTAGPTPTIYTTTNLVSGTVSAADGGWHHVAAVRSGSSLRLYVDGQQSGTTTTITSSFSAAATTGVVIGAQNAAATGRLNGALANVRIVNGAAVYTGTFTPPTAPVKTSGAASAASYSTLTNVNTTFAASACAMLLDFDDAAVYDATGNTAVATYFEARSSDAQSKWNNKQSLYFDGTNYMTWHPTSNFGTGPFTVEAWVWPVNAVETFTVIESRNSAQINNWIFGQYLTPGRLSWYNGTAYVISDPGSQFTSPSAWNHIMYTRVLSGTTAIGMMYCNGVRVASATDTKDYNIVSNAGTIGASYDNTRNFRGYIDDVRITTGFARTSAYTYVVPPRPAPIR